MIRLIATLVESVFLFVFLGSGILGTVLFILHTMGRIGWTIL